MLTNFGISITSFKDGIFKMLIAVVSF